MFTAMILNGTSRTACRSGKDASEHDKHGLYTAQQLMTLGGTTGALTGQNPVKPNQKNRAER